MDIEVKYKQLIEEVKRLKDDIPKNQNTKAENVAEIMKLLEKIEHLFEQSAGNSDLVLIDLEGLALISKMLVDALD